MNGTMLPLVVIGGAAALYVLMGRSSATSGAPSAPAPAAPGPADAPPPDAPEAPAPLIPEMPGEVVAPRRLPDTPFGSRTIKWPNTVTLRLGAPVSAVVDTLRFDSWPKAFGYWASNFARVHEAFSSSGGRLTLSGPTMPPQTYAWAPGTKPSSGAAASPPVTTAQPVGTKQPLPTTALPISPVPFGL